jgi:hypothetical protein
MNFIPAPPNDFAEFIETYFQLSRQRVPAIEAIAGKWTFEDLIPGLSDFDVRFIVRGPMSAAQWCAMSMEVAVVHLELVQARPHWARTLEHLPGVNLTWDELVDPSNFYPEFAQWSFYHAPAQRMNQFRELIANRGWTNEDAAFHWKKIAIYYGPYDRKIDPPINLGLYQSKYPLHSRIMHYFAPPLHSLVCLAQCESTPGKRDAFRQALELFPRRDTMRHVLDLIDRHYESVSDLEEPGLTRLEEALEQYLREAVAVVLANQSWLECAANPTPLELKAAVSRRVGEQGIAQFFELVKFARLMQGRLWFYTRDVNWFDSLPLLRIEMSRIRPNFLEKPLSLFAQHVLQESMEPYECLEKLRGKVLTPRQVESCLIFASLADPACPDSSLKETALQIVDCFEPFLDALETIVAFASCSMT